MKVKTSSILNQLGWRRFFQLAWHLPEFCRLFYRLINDERVALGPKLLVARLLVYVILPTDLVPDFLLGLGQLDDAAVLLGGLKLFLRLCPPETVEEHLRVIGIKK
jgi:uncharacterized membrane protein YkvA (DUF1232 family)